MSYFVFLSGCHGIKGKYCKHSVFLSIFEDPYKILYTLYFTQDLLWTAVMTIILFS